MVVLYSKCKHKLFDFGGNMPCPQHVHENYFNIWFYWRMLKTMLSFVLNSFGSSSYLFSRSHISAPRHPRVATRRLLLLPTDHRPDLLAARVQRGGRDEHQDQHVQVQSGERQLSERHHGVEQRVVSLWCCFMFVKLWLLWRTYEVVCNQTINRSH